MRLMERSQDNSPEALEFRARQKAALEKPIHPDAKAKIRAEITQSGVEGGVYDRDDREFVNVVRNKPTA